MQRRRPYLYPRFSRTKNEYVSLLQVICLMKESGVKFTSYIALTHIDIRIIFEILSSWRDFAFFSLSLIQTEFQNDNDEFHRICVFHTLCAANYGVY